MYTCDCVITHSHLESLADSTIKSQVNFLNVVFLIELEKWRSPDFYEREVHRMQLPFSGKVPGGSVSVEERQERRAQQLRRLQEINARRREEKLLQDQEKLDRLMAVQARHSVHLSRNFRYSFVFLCTVLNIHIRRNPHGAIH